VAISESDTDLRRSGTLSGELDNGVDELVGADLNPARRSSAERKASASDTLTLGIHAAHFFFGLLFNN
tara:strand:- start:91 stop:294 length:204 start_codon:yes stop_codon:yes gene_type:complete